MLSSERHKKLELLVSLIKTQQLPIILCAPDGVGKTTLLKQIVQSETQAGISHFLECDDACTVASMIAYLSSALSPSGVYASNPTDSRFASKLADDLNRMTDNGRAILFILDNAGCLRAGVLE